jgi:anti-anti-sigma factor
MAEPFQLRISATADGHVVAVSGEVDIAVAPTLAEALVQFGDGDVVVDLADVTFIGASGLCAILAAQRHVERRSHRLIVKTIAMTPVLCAAASRSRLACERQRLLGRPAHRVGFPQCRGSSSNASRTARRAWSLVPASAPGRAGTVCDPEDGADCREDDAERPQDRDAEQKADQQQNETDDEH